LAQEKAKLKTEGRAPLLKRGAISRAGSYQTRRREGCVWVGRFDDLSHLRANFLFTCLTGAASVNMRWGEIEEACKGVLRSTRIRDYRHLLERTLGRMEMANHTSPEVGRFNNSYLRRRRLSSDAWREGIMNQTFTKACSMMGGNSLLERKHNLKKKARKNSIEIKRMMVIVKGKTEACRDEHEEGILILLEKGDAHHSNKRALARGGTGGTFARVVTRNDY